MTSDVQRSHAGRDQAVHDGEVHIDIAAPGRRLSGNANGIVQALIAAYERVMPRVVGEHSGMLFHRDGGSLEHIDY